MLSKLEGNQQEGCFPVHVTRNLPHSVLLDGVHSPNSSAAPFCTDACLTDAVPLATADLLAECASDEGWRLIQDGKLRLLYRHDAGSTVHCFKASCCLPAPMEVRTQTLLDVLQSTCWV